MANSLYRVFGNSGLRVSVPGFGAGHIGGADQDDAAMGRLLNELVDNGITLFDTARGYNLSEERIGRHLAHRRNGIVISTKIGYGIEGVADWSYDCITRGVEEALAKLRTDRIDIVHLHSCPRSTLENGEVIRALEECVRSGKVLIPAYSGENDALDFAVQSGFFGSVQCSINFCDQRALFGIIQAASQKGMGVIAKRPIANMPWRYENRPHGNYAEEYWHRYKTMNIDTRGLSYNELAVRYTAHAPGVSTCIIGTTSLEHMRQNVEWIAKGPLPQDLLQHIRDAFTKWDQGWTGQV